MNKETDIKEKILSRKDVFFIVLAFLILAIFYFIQLPEGLTHLTNSSGEEIILTHNGQVMIGILFMAAILWITEPIPLPVTGLLIMILQPLLGIMQSGAVFASFGNQAVFFLIGAFIIAVSIEKQGLHKRIALKFLSKFDKNPRLFTLGIMLACAFMSFLMPEHGVAALFLPIIASILIAMKIIPKVSNFGKVSMLSVTYGCSIGSLGTLIGGARNPLTVGILLQEGIEVTFIDWMIYAMPVVLISLPIVWLVLQFAFPIEIKDITKAKEEIQHQVTLEGKIKRKEIMVLIILLATILMWIIFSHSVYFGLAVIALFGAFLLFLTGCVSWKDVEKSVPWGIILLYGGAVTLGIGIQNTDAGEWIATQLFQNTGVNVYLVIIVIIIFTVLLTNIMSNIGAVALLLPIGLAISQNVPGISPVLASMTIALSGGLAFMLVIATPGNAITYSSGYFSTKDLFKAGVLANIICITVVFAVAIFYWIGILGL